MMDSIKAKTPANRYKAIADAIRKKNSTTELMHPADMPKAILDIVGGITFNIAYGETPPDDTSKLWIKANEPENISVGSDIEGVGSVKLEGYLPDTAYKTCAVRMGTKIYLMGGEISRKRIMVFDIITQKTTVLSTTLINEFLGYGCASVGTKIYLFGCSSQTTTSRQIQVFDTETETVRLLDAQFDNYVDNMACVAIGTKIYLLGGRHGGSRSPYIYLFDTETEALSRMSVFLPNSFHEMGCASIGTKIYLFGGYDMNYIPYIYEFDTEKNIARAIDATLPTPCMAMSCATVGNKIYLFGGRGYNFLNTICEFDAETEAVTILDATLPIACYSSGCSVYGNKVYLFGGYGNGYLNTVNCFTLTHELAQGDIEVQSGLLKNKINLINAENAQVEIGVENVFIGNDSNEAELCEAYLYNGTEWAVI